MDRNPLQAMSAIALKNASFSYQKTPVLENANLSIERGSFIGVFGPNGGGKTTFLKLLMGFLTPDRGTVSIFGRSPETVREKIGYVPQAHRTDPDFPISVKELIALGLLSSKNRFGGFGKSDWERCEFWMEKLNLTFHRDKAYSELSGGLAQRALLARALIADPELILLDEPTANIDAASTAILLETLEQFKGSKTILFVTHDFKAIANRADQLLCIHRTISLLQPEDICEHFAFGLYHPPLVQPTPFTQPALR